MKKHRKLYQGVVAATMLGMSAAMLSACGDSSSGQVDDLKFDFTTGDYSFSGNEDAAEYRVRIFPVTDGKEEELPINESQPLRGGEESYSGNLPLWTLTPGATYNAYVMTTDENGENVMSSAVEGKYVAIYETVTEGVTAGIENNVITVTLDGEDLKNNYGTGAEYVITLKKDGEAAEEKTLTEADLVEVEQENQGGMPFGGGPGPGGPGPGGPGGPGGGAASYTGTVTFENVDAAANYTVSVTVESTSEDYLPSEASEEFEVVNAPAAAGE